MFLCARAQVGSPLITGAAAASAELVFPCSTPVGGINSETGAEFCMDDSGVMVRDEGMSTYYKFNSETKTFDAFRVFEIKGKTEVIPCGKVTPALTVDNVLNYLKVLQCEIHPVVSSKTDV